MVDKAFDFYQDHSRNFLEMAFRTDRHQRLEHADGFGERTGVCGDTVAMYIRMNRDRIGSVAFVIQGCIHTNACANTVAELAEDKTVAEAWNVEVEDVIAFLETLPEDHHHCAELAVGAFYLALSDLRRTQRHPWKKNYPTRRAPG